MLRNADGMGGFIVVVCHCRYFPMGDHSSVT